MRGCRNCKDPVATELDLCDPCHEDWTKWLAAAYERGRTHDTDVSHPLPQ